MTVVKVDSQYLYRPNPTTFHLPKIDLVQIIFCAIN